MDFSSAILANGVKAIRTVKSPAIIILSLIFVPLFFYLENLGAAWFSVAKLHKGDSTSTSRLFLMKINDIINKN